MSEVTLGWTGVALLAFLGWCRSGDSFGVISMPFGLSRIFSASSALRTHRTLILSETKPHH